MHVDVVALFRRARAGFHGGGHFDLEAGGGDEGKEGEEEDEYSGGEEGTHFGRVGFWLLEDGGGWVLGN